MSSDTDDWKGRGAWRHPLCLRRTWKKNWFRYEVPWNAHLIVTLLTLLEGENSIVWLLPDRYVLNHCSVVWRTANVFSSLVMRMSRSMVSKAADMSKSKRRETWLSFNAILMSDTILRTAVSMEAICCVLHCFWDELGDGDYETFVKVGRMDYVPVYGGNGNRRNVSCSKRSLPQTLRWAGRQIRSWNSLFLFTPEFRVISCSSISFLDLVRKQPIGKKESVDRQSTLQSRNN